MNIITMFVILMMAYYSVYFLSLALAPRRKMIVTKNEKLEKMRHIAVKSLKQQKAFLDTKFPRYTKTNVGAIIFNVLGFLIFSYVYRLMAIKANINLSWFEGIGVIIVIVAGVYFILRPFKLQTTDIDVFLK